jgi:hypothetical protein
MFQLLGIKVFNSSKQILFLLLFFYSWKQNNNFTITQLVSSTSLFASNIILGHNTNTTLGVSTIRTLNQKVAC